MLQDFEKNFEVFFFWVFGEIFLRGLKSFSQALGEMIFSYFEGLYSGIWREFSWDAWEIDLSAFGV